MDITSGYLVYRYQNIYYRQELYPPAQPVEYGRNLVDSVPRNPAGLEAWVLAVIEKIQKEKEYRLENNLADENNGRDFIDVHNLDNRILTVNGSVHLKLDNMPQTESFVDHFEHTQPIAPEYLTTPSFWPDPHFDTEEARQKYSALQPIVVPPEEWGAPTWDTLSVAHHLSIHLIRTLVQDNSMELMYSHFAFMQRQLKLFCWQLACAAAPLNLICPPLNPDPIGDIFYVVANEDNHPESYSPKADYHVGCNGFQRRFFWFRGCLVTFRRRLNEPVFMMHEVEEMAARLGKHEHTSNIGIIISSRQMVSVEVNGSEVRHSPVLDLHDGKGELNEGVLLLMHLLSPVSTVSKIPWREISSTQPSHIASPAVPQDILRYIIHFTDHETYLRLPLVSRLVRSICLAHPRVGDYFLLSKEPSLDATFRVQSTKYTSTALATLTRTKATRTRSGQRARSWYYRSRNYRGLILNAGLAGMFQHRQVGVGSRENASDEVHEWLAGINESAEAEQVKLRWNHIAEGNLPEMRILALDGVWQMLEAGIQIES